ncbi:uncharacterized protein [Coffea arabica]|uniref:Integrase catalytic domain-containing protein n=1 Tax=Coffea arabica TaxID=13443 RepID=A0ABM4X895_COFAR
MDFIEGLPKSLGHDAIMVVVDRLTKYAHFISMGSHFTAKSVALVFFEQIYKLHGLPVDIIFDRDKIFTSLFWQELFHQTNTGLTGHLLRGIGFTSSYSLVDRPLWLFEKIELAAKYYRPHQIEKRIGAVAYKLKLPLGAAIHPVFHVSLLKPSAKGAPASTILPQPSDEGFFSITPSSILDRRWIDRDGHKVEQILVQWKDLQNEDATWEDFSVIKSQFPDFNPRD